MLEEQGRLSEALAMYREALHILSTAYGSDHLRTGEVLGSLGRLQARLGDLHQARRMLAQSLDICGRTYGPTHPDLIESRRQLALVEAELARGPGPVRASRNEAASGALGPQ